MGTNGRNGPVLCSRKSSLVEIEEDFLAILAVLCNGDESFAGWNPRNCLRGRVCCQRPKGIHHGFRGRFCSKSFFSSSCNFFHTSSLFVFLCSPIVLFCVVLPFLPHLVSSRPSYFDWYRSTSCLTASLTRPAPTRVSASFASCSLARETWTLLWGLSDDTALYLFLLPMVADQHSETGRNGVGRCQQV